MILVMLGTQDKSFHRLLEEIESLIKKGIIQDDVIVQKGYTVFQSSYMETFDFIEPEKLNQLVKEAKYIICHGGVGTIIGALRKGKVVIAVPRLKKYEEHTNDHQLQIINRFEEDEYLIGCYNVHHLEDAIQKVETFQPKPFRNSNDRMIKLIRDMIEHEGE